jgi:hypothetical protein
MSVVAAIRQMLDAGLTVEQALVAAAAFEGNVQPAKSARQERNARYYDRKASEKRLKASETSYSDDQDANRLNSDADDDTSRAHVVISSVKEEKKEGSLSLPSEARPLDEAELALDAYNSAAKLAGWVTAAKLTAPRRSSIKARLSDAGGLDGWREAMNRARGSPFLSGDNDRGWRPNLDFFLQAKSFTKLIEGTYDDRNPRNLPSGQPASRPRSGADAYLAAIREEAEQLDDRGFPDRRDPGADFGNGRTLDLDAIRAA